MAIETNCHDVKKIKGTLMVTIQKSTKTKGSKVRVTFAMPAIDACDCLYLVGRFNEWNEGVYRMQRADDGTWSLTLELESGREFQYRFRTNDGRWLADPSAPPASIHSYLKPHSFAHQQ
jgi:1,4-alpha-glucan branching enzyme